MMFALALVASTSLGLSATPPAVARSNDDPPIQIWLSSDNSFVRGERARYENVTFDLIEGDLVYSPDQLTVARGHVRRGGVDTQIDGTLALTDWSFLAGNAWSADASFGAAPVGALQQLVGMSYPVRGNLSGQFHGHGTRAEPVITGLFDLADGDVYDVELTDYH